MRREFDPADSGVNAGLSALTLSEDERRLLASLRALPDGALRERVWNMLAALSRMLHDPHCSQVQADGVPCAKISGECEQCRRVLDELEELPSTALPS